MKTISALLFYVFILVQNSYSYAPTAGTGIAGPLSILESGSSVAGITVAGGNGDGQLPSQLNLPSDVAIDALGNMYVADKDNHRIQKFAPGSATGITVAGGHGQGSAPDQLNHPYAIYVDNAGNIYIADATNARIQKWAPGASAGITVAGGHGIGSLTNQLNFPTDVFVDASGNIFIADNINNRIQKWEPGDSNGITVAGGHGEGAAANQLYRPFSVFIDAAGNIYISDEGNERIQKWAPGAAEGVTVAGGNGQGSAAYQLFNPYGIFVDTSGNVYVADAGNSRIQKWVPGASEGITIAGGNGRGSATNQLYFPYGVFMAETGSIFVADNQNHRIQKFEDSGIPDSLAKLSYKYYEGSWNSLPDFNALTPLKSDYSRNVDITANAAGRNDNYALLWQGSIYIPKPGAYTFETLSDDGSRLYFNSDYVANAIATVDNDGLHAEVSSTGTVNVPAIGSYPITISYFQKEGGKSMRVYWSGPGMPRQPIPDEAFSSSQGSDNIAPGTPSDLHVLSKGGNMIILDWNNSTDNTGVIAYDIYVGGVLRYTTYESQITADSLLPNTSYTFAVKARDFAGNSSEFSNAITDITINTINGLNYKYYEGTWDSLPDFNTLTPVKTGSTLNINISERSAAKNDHFAFVWEGFINIDNPGNYTFETISDDGSKIYLNTPYSATAIPIVSNNGLHAPVAAVSVAQFFAYPQLVPVTITYFEKDAGETMQVYWTKPGNVRELIPSSAFRQTDKPTNLSYSYYEGDWESLPDLTKLTPVTTGYSPNIDIKVRPEGKPDHFAFKWEGHINIPVAGSYTFETLSDDGSRFYFNSAYSPSAIATVTNDGVHAPTSAAATVSVPVAGTYPIALTFFEKDGGETMQLFWSGPGFERQPVPDAAFGAFTQDNTKPSDPTGLKVVYTGKSFAHLSWSNTYDNIGVIAYDIYVNGVKQYSCTERSITADRLDPNTTYTFMIRARDRAGNVSLPSNPVTATTTAQANGVKYRYFENDWSQLTNFNNEYPVKTDSSANINLNVRNNGVNDRFGFVWEGLLYVPTPGNYTFETVSDDGSSLYFNCFYIPGAMPLINNDGIHAPVSVTGTVNVSVSGWYPFAASFFEHDGDHKMEVYWTGPGITRQLIPDAAFKEAPLSTGIEKSGRNLGSSGEDKVTINRVYPDPFSDRFTIDFFNLAASNDINISVADLNGRSIYTYHAGKMAMGNSSVKVLLNRHHLPDGMYFVTLKINGKIVKTLPMLRTKY